MNNELEKQFKEKVFNILYGIIISPNVYNSALSQELSKLEKIIDEVNNAKTLL